MSSAWSDLAIDARDRSPDDAHLLNRDGNGLYLIGIGPAGPDIAEHIPATWDREVDAFRAAMPDEDCMPPLCGDLHFELLEIWQLPHSARPPSRRVVKIFERTYGVRAQVFRMWQHYGPCEQARGQ